MKLITTVLILLSFKSYANLSVKEAIKGEVYTRVSETCTRQKSEEKSITAKIFSYDDFTSYTNGSQWFTNKTGMERQFKKLYQSELRLNNRAYFNKESKQYVIDVIDFNGNSEGQIILPKNFINSISLHIQSALERGLAEYIFFPDMGHAHYYLPTKEFKEKIVPMDSIIDTYNALFQMKDLKSLYHTAEKLALNLDEGPLDPYPYRRDRYQRRNIIGDNLSLGVLEVLYNYADNFNTVKRYRPDHREFSAGHYIHANKNGCFSYKHNGKKFRFDINIDGLIY